MSKEWGIYWNVYSEEKRGINRLGFVIYIHIASNFQFLNARLITERMHANPYAVYRGRPFNFSQFRTIMQTKWEFDKHGDKCSFVDFKLAQFSTHSMLLGALRSEQYDRFRRGGLKRVDFDEHNQDKHGHHRPVATALYQHKFLFLILLLLKFIIIIIISRGIFMLIHV